MSGISFSIASNFLSGYIFLVYVKAWIQAFWEFLENAGTGDSRRIGFPKNLKANYTRNNFCLGFEGTVYEAKSSEFVYASNIDSMDKFWTIQ